MQRTLGALEEQSRSAEKFHEEMRGFAKDTTDRLARMETTVEANGEEIAKLKDHQESADKTVTEMRVRTKTLIGGGTLLFSILVFLTETFFKPAWAAFFGAG